MHVYLQCESGCIGTHSVTLASEFSLQPCDSELGMFFALRLENESPSTIIFRAMFSNCAHLTWFTTMYRGWQ